MFISIDTRRIDTIEAALLSDKRTDYVSTNRLSMPETGANQSREVSTSSQPLSHTAELRMMFYDTIGFLMIILSSFRRNKRIFRVY